MLLRTSILCSPSPTTLEPLTTLALHSARQPPDRIQSLHQCSNAAVNSSIKGSPGVRRFRENAFGPCDCLARCRPLPLAFLPPPLLDDFPSLRTVCRRRLRCSVTFAHAAGPSTAINRVCTGRTTAKSPSSLPCSRCKKSSGLAASRPTCSKRIGTLKQFLSAATQRIGCGGVPAGAGRRWRGLPHA